MVDEQSGEVGESGEAGGGPVAWPDPPVETAVAPEEAKWSREGTEVDPDEEMSLDEGDQYQMDET